MGRVVTMVWHGCACFSWMGRSRAAARRRGGGWQLPLSSAGDRARLGQAANARERSAAGRQKGSKGVGRAFTERCSTAMSQRGRREQGRDRVVAWPGATEGCLTPQGQGPAYRCLARQLANSARSQPPQPRTLSLTLPPVRTSKVNDISMLGIRLAVAAWVGVAGVAALSIDEARFILWVSAPLWLRPTVVPPIAGGRSPAGVRRWGGLSWWTTGADFTLLA